MSLSNQDGIMLDRVVALSSTNQRSSAMKPAIVVCLLCSFVIGCNKPYHSSIQSPNPAQQPAAHQLNDPFKLQTSNPIQHTIQASTPTTAPKPTNSPKPPSLHNKSRLNLPVHQTQQKRLTLVQLRNKYPQVFKLNGSPREKKIALTFDDGPDDIYTPQILDILHKHRVSATFFVTGSRSKTHPAMIKRIVNEGHALGNHSYNHANPDILSEPQFQNQIEQTQRVLKQIIGYEPRLIRTPYGAIQEAQLHWAAQHGFVVVNWDIDSLDWKQLNAAQVLANILSHTHRGAIVLQHSAGGDHQDLSGTVKALPTVIEKLKMQGYELVTVPQLLHVNQAK
jgi:peptidoglycan/xylan/chitin deacetylase (PgdA/CDA1 family)